MPETKETWGEYSKLVLAELERLNENSEKMRSEMNEVLSTFKNTERLATENKIWVDKVNEVWSPLQMKEAKDEIYSQKNKWVATIAIVAFLQVVIGFLIAIWSKIH